MKIQRGHDMQKPIPLTEARAKLSDIVNGVMYRGDAYIISKLGKPAAAVVPVDVWEAWQAESEERDRVHRFALLDAIHLRTKSSPAAAMSDEALMEFIDECIHEVREQTQQETPDNESDS